jgi:hypothetical protein
MKNLFSFLLAMSAFALSSESAELRVLSPDGRIAVVVSDEGGLRYRVDVDHQPLILSSRLGLEFANGLRLGPTAKIEKSENTDYDGFWENKSGKRRAVRDKWNQLGVSFLETGVVDRRLGVLVRVFDDGVALRYDLPEESKLDSFVLYHEKTEFVFAGDYPCWAGEPSACAETKYQETKVSAIPRCNADGAYRSTLPLVVQTPSLCVAVAESGVRDWADMFLTGTGATAVRVTLSSREDGRGCVASQTPCQSPWRVLMIARSAGGLVGSDLIATLASDHKPALSTGIRMASPSARNTVTLPFTRGLLGPVDYIQGCQTNGQPVTKGTLARQLAMPMICQSPHMGLSDNPASPSNTVAGVEFVRGLPTAWDDTVVPSAELARHIVVARRLDGRWWLAAINSDAALKIRVPLRFLEAGKWSLHGYSDVADAVVEKKQTVDASDVLELDLVPDGGYAATLTPVP